MNEYLCIGTVNTGCEVLYTLYDTNGNSVTVSKSDILKAIKQGKADILNLKINKNETIAFREYYHNLEHQFPEITSDLSNSAVLNANNLRIIQPHGEVKFEVGKATMLHKAKIVQGNNCMYFGAFAAIKTQSSTTFITDKDKFVLDTSELQIGATTFSQCTNVDLTNVEMTRESKALTPLFYGARIKNLNMGTLGNHTLQSLDATFLGVHIVGELHIEKIDTSRIINMNSVFGNSYIENVDLSNMRSDSLVMARNMFKSCHIPIIKLTSFNSENIKDMHGMFQECEAALVDLSTFKIDKNTLTYNMFKDCKIQRIRINRRQKLLLKQLKCDKYHGEIELV